MPYALVKKQLDIRYSQKTVECFHSGKRVASHVRSGQPGRHTTVKEHMPLKHQKYMEWTPERFKRWAAKIGPETLCLTEMLLVQRNHPQQAYRSLLGILSLGKSYGEIRLEAACRRALYINALSYRSVQSILKSGLDHKPLPEPTKDKEPVEHSNIRGSVYYTSSIH